MNGRLPQKKRNILIRIYMCMEWIVRVCITLFISTIIIASGVFVLIGIISVLKKDTLEGFFIVKEKSQPNVLLFDPQGVMKEIYEGSYGGFNSSKLLLEVKKSISFSTNIISLQEFTEALYKAAKDKNIQAAVFNFQDLVFDSLLSQQAATHALQTFKNSGKKIVIFDTIDMSTYMASSTADVLVVDELDPILLTGMKNGNLYQKGFYDKLKVDVEVFYQGKYKSSPEVYFRDSLSKYAKENLIEIVTGDWNKFLSLSATNRGISVFEINNFINTYDVLLSDEKRIAYVARDMGLVTHLYKGGESKSDYLIELLSTELKKDKQTFRYKSYQNYIDNAYLVSESKYNVAVISLEGKIEEQISTDTTMGSFSVVPFLQDISDDTGIKAIVIRVNSPGGDVIAAQKIRRKILFIKEKRNIPVVVSMGRVAASGGYLISTVADLIIADPFTITGSIGVYAVDFNFNNFLDSLGIYWDGYTTTWLADINNNKIPLTERMQNLKTLQVEKIYKRFLGYVAKARNMSIQEVDTIAQGKVYTATGALKVNLIDKIGTLQDAIKIAAERAKLDEIKVAYFVPAKKINMSNSINFFLATTIKKNLASVIKTLLFEDQASFR